jgi:CHASE2 domain-containing sensor protein
MRDSPRKKGVPFHHEWLHHLLALVIITIVILLLEQTSMLEGVESLGFDRMARSYPAKVSPDIYLVEITDDDYRIHFKNTSPLDAEELALLLNRIHDLHPIVLGVDLDTEDPKVQDDAEMKKLRESRDIIWAVVPEVEASESERGVNQTFVLAPTANAFRLGSKALPNFPRDVDGVVRRFRDGYRATLDGKPQELASLGCALAYRDGSASQCTENPKIRRFSLVGSNETFKTVDADEFLADDFDSRDKARRASGDQTDNPLAGKIVLVGGNYRAARDSYVTPAGEKPGLEVIANAAQSYLPGGKSILEAPWWASGLFDLLIGTGVILLYWAFRLKTAFWLNLLAAPVAAMAISFVAFLLVHYWLAFAPVLFGMMLHHLYDHIEQLDELDKAGDEEKSSNITIVNISYRIQRLLQYPRRDRSSR